MMNLSDFTINPNKKHLFQLRINGPLFQPIKEELSNQKIKLLEYFHPYSYVVRLTTQEAENCKKLPFVTCVESYKVHLVMISTNMNNSNLIYNVGVYEPEDIKDVELWLKGYPDDVQILNESEQKIRIKVSNPDHVHIILKDIPSTVKYFEEYMIPSFSF
jgi:hypothetical protein